MAPLVGQGLRLYSGGDGELLLAFKQEGDLVTLEAELKRGRRGRGGGREAGWEATANLKVVQV